MIDFKTDPKMTGLYRAKLAFLGKIMFRHSLDDTMHVFSDDLGMTPYEYLSECDSGSSIDDDFVRVGDMDCICYERVCVPKLLESGPKITFLRRSNSEPWMIESKM
jgi:hypothetical protein